MLQILLGILGCRGIHKRKEDVSRQFGKLSDRHMAIFSLRIRKVKTATLP